MLTAIFMGSGRRRFDLYFLGLVKTSPAFFIKSDLYRTALAEMTL